MSDVDLSLSLPPFFWGAERPLVAVWDADLKVDESAVAAAEARCALPSAMQPWPFPTVYTAGAWADASRINWALNDPSRTLDLMNVNQINLYLHDARAGGLAGWFDNAFVACDWVSFAALHDAIAERPPIAEEVFTGMILGNIEPESVIGQYSTTSTTSPPITTTTAFHPDALGAGLEACYYRDWLARARTEAKQHSALKLVMVDELTQSLSSPFEAWSGQTRQWTADDVALLGSLARELDSTDPGSARAICDGVWQDIVDDGMIPAVGVPAPSRWGERPVELWTRAVSATVPLFLLPSTILGVPAESVAGEQADDVLPNGGALAVRWALPAHATFPVGSGLPVTDPQQAVGRVRLKYFATTLSAGQAIELAAWVNGQRQASTALHVAGGGPGSTEAEFKNIYMVDVVLSEPPGDPEKWVEAGQSGPRLGPLSVGAPNEIELRLARTGDAVNGADRAFVISGARVVVEDGLGDVIREYALRPEDALGVAIAAAGVEAPCVEPQLCRDNKTLRIDHQLDGLTIAHDVRVEWPEPVALSAVAPLDEAWDEFISFACDRFGLRGPGGVRRRCLVDERAWVSDYSLLEALEDETNIANSLSRLRSGLFRADGAVLLWLTLELEDMLGDLDPSASGPRGRFGARDPMDAAWPYLAYLPALTRNMLGEGVVWNVQVLDPDLPACRGDWTVEWKAPEGCPTRWTYGPNGQRWDPDGDGGAGAWRDAIVDAATGELLPDADLPYYQLIEAATEAECTPSAGEQSGSYSIELPETAAGRLRFGWEIKDDNVYTTDADGNQVVVSAGRTDVGDSNTVAQYVEMRLTPPAGCSPADYTVEQAAVVDESLRTYYEAVIDVIDGPAWSELFAGTP